MPLLAAFVTALYAFVNAFGAWMVIRRKPWVAGLFMLAAAVLMVAAAAMVSFIPYTRVILAAGLVMASITSWLNARIVIGKVELKNHLIRAVVAVCIYLLADVAVG